MKKLFLSTLSVAGLFIPFTIHAGQVTVLTDGKVEVPFGIYLSGKTLLPLGDMAPHQTSKTFKTKYYGSYRVQVNATGEGTFCSPQTFEFPKGKVATPITFDIHTFDRGRCPPAPSEQVEPGPGAK